ncbi:uncharacterized protein AB675_3854 [Cyphellophora attinorum]|uniref:Alpha-1,3-mannosyltransferase CMT1 n=1 Tax=Cyphellophora attinorum TaxID=1664694 RepID=A0A0N1HH38_9EURO|nr:uncharacterized protein AB675_3854 [Phialophora attinorum]KPI34956.1 hypothetical protein AB675_3854 [Phialophora attinorum]
MAPHSEGETWGGHHESLELTSRDDAQDANLLTGRVVNRGKYQVSNLLGHVIPSTLRYTSYRRAPSPSRRRPRFCGRSLARSCVSLSYITLVIVILYSITGFIFFPNYSTLPPQYEALREQATSSNAPGSGNPKQQKVFIASNLYDPHGQLADGPWADNVLRLIHLLGPDNTYLSIYENDSGDVGSDAMDRLRAKTPCNNTLVVEDHLDRSGLPKITLVDGRKRVKRITYLAEVRNKALEPLADAETIFDKVLFLNDVYFDPVEILQLIFATNDGNYRAACAVDFINPFKFYDTFASRDLGGYSMGVPFFPWFSRGGDPRTHDDVIQGKDAVRVRSCWGGMVSFDATFFQPSDEKIAPITASEISPANLSAPYRFRAEEDTYWEASECCLIHADIQSPDHEQSGIFMNPFVRVGYTPRTHAWLGFTKRFEALYTPVHYLVDIIAGFPHHNARREEEPWSEVDEVVWVIDESLEEGGSFQQVTRLASHSAFCGHRALSVMNEEYSGEVDIDSYEKIPLPSGGLPS